MQFRQNKDKNISNSQFRQHKETNEKKPTRYYSNIQETNVANAIGGKKVANSGATAYNKGDVTSEKVLIECKTKTTNSDSISIKKEWLTKLRDESIFMKKPFYSLFFNFGPNENNYVIIPESLYIQVLEKINNGEIE